METSGYLRKTFRLMVGMTRGMAMGIINSAATTQFYLISPHL